jgi:class 3 adenylate cyclase/pimeloyl-ACP methyl ester carboxylesterase
VAARPGGARKLGHNHDVELPETRYVNVGDGQVAYQVLGDGPIDLVFNHGHCHIDVHWELEPEADFFFKLASFSRLILFDRRSSGASDRLEGGRFPTWEEWTQDLTAVLDAVGSERAAIFAEYEAGPLAIFFAATHPDRVTSLVLGNSSARVSWAEDYQIGASTEEVEFFVTMLEEVWGKPECGAFFPSIANDPRICEQLAKVARASATPHAAAQQARYYCTELDARQSLPLVQVPTLVMSNRLAGVFSDGKAAKQTRYLAEHIDGARYVEFDNADAMFCFGINSEVVDEVSEFLTGARVWSEPDRVLATVLFTDIVGSTERAAADGDHRWRSLLDEHDAAIRHELARFRGREIKNTGDGFLASFDGPARAVRCGQSIVDNVHRLGIDARVGVHTGECEVRGNDLAGLAVHIASRVAGCAGPSNIWVSSTVRDLVVGSDLSFDSMGRFTLKGVPDEWSLYRVAEPGSTMVRGAT